MSEVGSIVYLFLVTLAWQGTAMLAVGLACSFMPRARPSRAHLVLLTGMGGLPAVSVDDYDRSEDGLGSRRRTGTDGIQACGPVDRILGRSCYRVRFRVSLDHFGPSRAFDGGGSLGWWRVAAN